MEINDLSKMNIVDLKQLEYLALETNINIEELCYHVLEWKQALMKLDTYDEDDKAQIHKVAKDLLTFYEALTQLKATFVKHVAKYFDQPIDNFHNMQPTESVVARLFGILLQLRCDYDRLTANLQSEGEWIGILTNYMDDCEQTMEMAMFAFSQFQIHGYLKDKITMDVDKSSEESDSQSDKEDSQELVVEKNINQIIDFDM